MRGGGVQFYKKNPSKQNLQISQSFAQKVKEGGQFYKRNLLKKFLKSSKFCSKKWVGVNFAKEIHFKEISENIKNLLILSKKFKNALCAYMSFEAPYFLHNFTKTHFPIRVLTLKSQLPNLTSNFETHMNVGDNFLLHIQVGI